MKLLRCTSFVLLALTLTACGGSSSDSGTLIEGTLTEAGGAGHRIAALLRHSEGARIEDVVICALGECSVTDGEGQWGFVIPGNFPGGDVLFTIEGHGIDTESTFSIPANASEVVLDLVHVAGGLVTATHMTVDGAHLVHTEEYGNHGHAE